MKWLCIMVTLLFFVSCTNNLTGQAVAPFDEDTAIRVVLDKGWNQISVNVAPEDTSMEAIFAPVKNKLMLVKDNQGNVYWPEYEIYDLAAFDYTKSYMVYMHEPAVLLIGGRRVNPSVEITLYKGWNSLAYLPQDPKRIDEVFAPYKDYIEYVRTYHEQFYSYERDANEITLMRPGVGYDVYVNDDIIFSYAVG